MTPDERDERKWRQFSVKDVLYLLSLFALSVACALQWSDLKRLRSSVRTNSACIDIQASTIDSLITDRMRIDASLHSATQDNQAQWTRRGIVQTPSPGASP